MNARHDGRVLVATGLALALTASGCRQSVPGAVEPSVPPDPGAVFEAEVQRWGGSHDAWYDQLADFRHSVEALLQAAPADAEAIEGRDGFLFYRASLDCLLQRDFRMGQRHHRNPYDAVVHFDGQLRQFGIVLVFAPIPTKAEVYPDHLTDSAPARDGPYVCPAQRRLLRDLTDAGIVIADLLPAFIAERDARDDPLFMPGDTHWTSRGVMLAARVIADTVRATPQFADSPRPEHMWRVQSVSQVRQGDLVGMLAEERRDQYEPFETTVQVVLDDSGQPYADDPLSPLVILGDSNAAVYGTTPDKPGHGGLSAHLARELGWVVDLMAIAGNGPMMPGIFARRGIGAVRSKRVVVWTMTDRDLWSSPATWIEVELGEMHR